MGNCSSPHPSPLEEIITEDHAGRKLNLPVWIVHVPTTFRRGPSGEAGPFLHGVNLASQWGCFLPLMANGERQVEAGARVQFILASLFPLSLPSPTVEL